MVTQTMKIYEAAEKLPPLERIELIERLFFSLDSKRERERIDSLWATEAEDRLTAHEQGVMKSIPAKDVFGKLESNDES